MKHPGSARVSWLAHIENFLCGFSALSIFSMMCVMTLSVVMRYAFNTPLIWTYKLISVYFLVGAFYPVIASTLRKNEHIAIDVFVPYLNEKWVAPIRAFGYLASAVLLGTICYLYWGRFTTSWVRNELVSLAIPLPLWVTYAMVCIGTFFTALRCIAKARHEIRSAYAPKS